MHIPVRCKSEQDLPDHGNEGPATQAGCFQCFESSKSIARRRRDDIDQLHQRGRFRISDKRQDRDEDVPGTTSPDLLEFQFPPPLKARIQSLNAGLLLKRMRQVPSVDKFWKYEIEICSTNQSERQRQNFLFTPLRDVLYVAQRNPQIDYWVIDQPLISKCSRGFVTNLQDPQTEGVKSNDHQCFVAN